MCFDGKKKLFKIIRFGYRNHINPPEKLIKKSFNQFELVLLER